MLIDWKRDTKTLDLRSHLLDLTIGVLGKIDSDTGKPRVASILDSAEQKGTGMRASQTGMELGVPMPTIDAAVAARNISSYRHERKRASDLYGDIGRDTNERLLWTDSTICGKLKEAFYCSELITCAQGFDLLLKASLDSEHQYNYTLAEVCQVWKRGALIRANLLRVVERALRRNPQLPNLLLDGEVSDKMRDLQSSLRFIVRIAKESGIPIPALNASLDYFDSLRTKRLPANIIQAVRDSFGAHKYLTVDNPAGEPVHTIWPKRESPEDLEVKPLEVTHESKVTSAPAPSGTRTVAALSGGALLGFTVAGPPGAAVGGLLGILVGAAADADRHRKEKQP